MLFSLNWPTRPELVNTPYLREACGFHDVDVSAVPLLPDLLPGRGDALTIGFIAGHRDDEPNLRCTAEEAIAFYRWLHSANEIWDSPSPERALTRIFITGPSRVPGQMLVVLLERDRDVVIRRTLTATSEQPRMTDWVMRRH